MKVCLKFWAVASSHQAADEQQRPLPLYLKNLPPALCMFTLLQAIAKNIELAVLGQCFIYSHALWDLNAWALSTLGAQIANQIAKVTQSLAEESSWSDDVIAAHDCLNFMIGAFPMSVRSQEASGPSLKLAWKAHGVLKCG